MACTVSIGCLCCSKPGPTDLRWRWRVLALPSHTICPNTSAPCSPSHPTWPNSEENHRSTPSLSPSELDRLDPSHRARTRMQHAASRSTRQRRPLFTPLLARAVSWPPLDTACAPPPAYKRPPLLNGKMHTPPSPS
jgi:hypothetical protein